MDIRLDRNIGGKQMKKDMFIIIIGALIGYLIGTIFVSLIFWGVGNLIVYVFSINYAWTFLHGLICTLIFQMIKDILNKGN